MIVTIHQPDLLPYSGFWFKMATSDVFVVAVHDQFQKHGYQRRVKMRDTWVSHQLVGKPSLVPINTIEVQPGWQGRLVDAIRGRYTGARYFSTRGRVLLEQISAAQGTRLDEVNLALIEIIRGHLGLDTPLMTTPPPTHQGVDRLIEQVQAADGDTYLSGAGGTAYMGEDAPQRFADAGIELRWSAHEMSTGDSIMTVLMDTDDPREVILRAHG